MSDINIKLPNAADFIGFSSLEKAASQTGGSASQPPGPRSRSADVKKTKVTSEVSLAPGEALDKAAAAIDKFVPRAEPNTRLSISKDEKTGIFVYRSIDQKTGRIVAQYPSEEIIRFISYYREKEGVALDKSV